MFLQNLKRDFKWYFLISIVFLFAKIWINESLPLHVLALPVVLIFRILVASLLAFLFYSVAFSMLKVFRLLKK